MDENVITWAEILGLAQVQLETQKQVLQNMGLPADCFRDEIKAIDWKIDALIRIAMLTTTDEGTR